jgi:uncharacterized protein (DUF302 family)
MKTFFCTICMLLVGLVAPAYADPVVKRPLEPGISFDEAVQSMKLRANTLNIKLVAELPLSKQVEASTGKPQRRMEIFQFCDALTAKAMVEANIDFAAYLPCRIALIEDAQGKGWLVMVNLDEILGQYKLAPDMVKLAKSVRDTLVSIMDAGVKGDL